MAVLYDKLWKLLIDKKINRSKLAEICGISRTTISRMGKDEPVSLDVIERICIELNCKIEDVVEIVILEGDNIKIHRC